MKKLTKKQNTLALMAAPLLIALLLAMLVSVLGILGLGAEIQTWVGHTSPGAIASEKLRNGASGLDMMHNVAVWILCIGFAGSLISLARSAAPMFSSRDDTSDS